MTSQAHVIGRQVLEFELASERDAYTLPQELSEVFRAKVIPAMEALFDRCVPADVVLRLERLEVDLGRLPRDRLDETFAPSVCEALEAQLADHLHAIPTARAEGREECLSRDDHALALWHYVLLHGHLPWWAPHASAPTLESRVLEVLESRDALPPSTARLLREHPVAINRIVLQDNEALLERVLHLAAADVAAASTPVFESLARLVEMRAIKALRIDALRRNLWQAALEESVHATAPDLQTRLRALLRAALEASARSTSMAYRELLSQLRAHLQPAVSQTTPAIPAKIREVLLPVLPREGVLEGGTPSDDVPLVPDAPGTETVGDREHGPRSQETKKIGDARDARLSPPQPNKAAASPHDRHDESAVHAQQHEHPGDGRRTDGESRPRTSKVKTVGGETQAIERRNESSAAAPPDHPGQSATDAQLSAPPRHERRARGASRTRRSKVESVGAETSTPLEAPDRNPPSRRNASRSRTDTRPMETETRRAVTLSERHALFVDDAGIALLHPFLAAHFEKLGLQRDGTFLDDNARERAVHQLRFLATGEEEAPETLLVCAKIMCGLKPEVPIARSVPLDQRAKSEADVLLQAVIRNWGALKNTSPDGLRETFLRREGRLERKDDGWKLRVESRSYDLLLDRLPWPLSVVRLPWMAGLLFVEWI